MLTSTSYYVLFSFVLILLSEVQEESETLLLCLLFNIFNFLSGIFKHVLFFCFFFFSFSFLSLSLSLFFFFFFLFLAGEAPFPL